jgi:HK97 gp10 family phage protein
MSGAKFDKAAISSTVMGGIVKGLASTQIGASRLVRATLSRPGMGTLYRVGQGAKGGRNLRARGFHRASLPGSPPAVNTNRLRASWSVERVWGGGGDTISAVYRQGSTAILRYGSNVPYARFLEFGTRRMKKRPYLRPTMPKIADISLKLIAVQVKAALREAR